MENIKYRKDLEYFEICLLSDITYRIPGSRFVYIEAYQKFPKHKKRRESLIKKLSRVYRNIFKIPPMLCGDYDGNPLDFKDFDYSRVYPRIPIKHIYVKSPDNIGNIPEFYSLAGLDLDGDIIDLNLPSAEELIIDGIKRN